MRSRGELIGICPVSASSAWWHDNIWPEASAVLFPRGRIRFVSPEGVVTDDRPMGDVALVHYGPGVGLFGEVMSPHGHVVVLRSDLL
jgi:hypothetical protein